MNVITIDPRKLGKTNDRLKIITMVIQEGSTLLNLIAKKRRTGTISYFTRLVSPFTSMYTRTPRISEFSLRYVDN
jgi:hypothetical protein